MNIGLSPQSLVLKAYCPFKDTMLGKVLITTNSIPSFLVVPSLL